MDFGGETDRGPNDGMGLVLMMVGNGFVDMAASFEVALNTCHRR